MVVNVKYNRVLVVDDDPHGLEFFVSSLKVAGYETVSAKNAQEAKAICLKLGSEQLVAVLSDYRMPLESGIDFLRWVRGWDETLSTLLITAQGEKSVVQESLSVGVTDYLEKPITHVQLKDSIEKAVTRTLRQRKYAQSEEDLHEMSKLDYLMNASAHPQIKDFLNFFYHPLHELGGDFFNTHYHEEEDEAILVVGDVSGHDVQAGFVSTFFQGMFIGLMEGELTLERSLQKIHQLIYRNNLTESSRSAQSSLSLNLIRHSKKKNRITFWNFGMNPIYWVCRNGFIHQGPYGNHPIGWFPEVSSGPVEVSADDISLIYIFTDGLEELANTLEVNSLSLAHMLLRKSEKDKKLIDKSTDDLFVLCYQLEPSNPEKALFEPILSEQYSGSEYERLDHLQSVWRRSIQFAIGDLMGDRLYDLLICLREGMANAFVHGCERSDEKFCQLQISYNKEDETIRVRIDDPGRGHEFDLKKRLEEIAYGKGSHLGLGIIQHLSDDFQIENRGTSLVFDFVIHPEQE